MATIGKSFLPLARRSTFRLNGRHEAYLRSFVRHRTTTDTGSMLPAPATVKFGLTKVIAITLPFLYFGATISKEGAAFLEEYDIFVPEDDD